MKKLKSINNEHIKQLISNSSIEYMRVFDTVIICAVKLPNGFTLIGHSACIDPNMYNEDMGKEIALAKTIEKLWDLEAYLVFNNKDKEANS